MKQFIVTTVLFLCFSDIFATSVTVSGNVSGTWTADTILVEGNLVIEPQQILTIASGTVVQFQSYFRIDVYGSIIATGSPSDTILFTIRDTSNFNAQTQGRGGWSGIRFRTLPENADSSQFSFCRFEYSKATEDSLNGYGGAILSDGFNKLHIKNCLFYHNYSYYSGGAVYLKSADAIIENCVFRNNYSGNGGTIYGYGGGICSINSSPVVKNNEFYFNSSTGVGGAVSFDNSNPVFENNIISLNYSALGGGFGILRSSPEATFSNNLVTANTALFFGGGICCIRSFPVFSNLTIAQNNAAYGGGFYCNDSASPSMYNSIMWGNTGLGNSVYIWDVRSAPNFYFCNIEGDSSSFEGSGSHLGYQGEYLNNLNENPQFIGAGLFPFQLLPLSPCIDSGIPDATFLQLPSVDLAGAMRVTNNIIDMGAYEYNGTTSTKPLYRPASKLSIYPIPMTTSVTISLPEPSDETTEVTIYDIKGSIINQLRISPGETGVSWDGKMKLNVFAPQGIYLIKACNSQAIYQGKIIK